LAIICALLPSFILTQISLSLKFSFLDNLILKKLYFWFCSILYFSHEENSANSNRIEIVETQKTTKRDYKFSSLWFNVVKIYAPPHTGTTVAYIFCKRLWFTHPSTVATTFLEFIFSIFLFSSKSIFSFHVWSRQTDYRGIKYSRQHPFREREARLYILYCHDHKLFKGVCRICFERLKISLRTEIIQPLLELKTRPRFCLAMALNLLQQK